jgi:hypothetical protein
LVKSNMIDETSVYKRTLFTKGSWQKDLENHVFITDLRGKKHKKNTQNHSEILKISHEIITQQLTFSGGWPRPASATRVPSGRTQAAMLSGLGQLDRRHVAWFNRLTTKHCWISPAKIDGFYNWISIFLC